MEARKDKMQRFTADKYSFNDYLSVSARFQHFTTRDVCGVYTILGIMHAGLAIAEIKTQQVDSKFVGMTFVAQFVVWPVSLSLLLWQSA